MELIKARCLLCGKTHVVYEDHKDYSKLANKQDPTFICDYCQNRVRYESEENNKPKKPI
ncbi:MAG: DUF2197 domain-containing protein [Syntrophomonadaceae bacterium]|jgi:uncharacterized protein YlaI